MEAMTAHLSANYPPELLALRKNEPLITTKSLCLSIIYHEKGVQPFWVTLSGTTERAAVIYDHLVNSYREGLDPADPLQGNVSRKKLAADAPESQTLPGLCTRGTLPSPGKLRVCLKEKRFVSCEAKSGERKFEVTSD